MAHMMIAGACEFEREFPWRPWYLPKPTTEIPGADLGFQKRGASRDTYMSLEVCFNYLELFY